MFVAEHDMEASVHAGMDCIDCHTDLSGLDDCPHSEELAAVDCTACHSETGDIFAESAHGQAGDGKNGPGCKTCHGKHQILSATDVEATTSARNLPYTCSNCHHEKVLADDPDLRFIDPFDRYMKSIHAEGISQGRSSSASCNDCHGIHDLKELSS